MKFGIAGIGFMGMIHYLTYQRVRGATVAALCEQDRRRLAGDWRDIKGNFGPAGKKIDLSGVATHKRLEDLVADPALDVIDITLPPSLHVETAIQALRGGKHVFCEKPMSLTPADCRRMLAAAEKAGRMLLIGHVLPFFPEYAEAYRISTSGKYGRLLGGNFKRVISDPQWLTGFYDPERIGGPMLDLHVHDAHFIRLLFGMPTAVASQGRMRGEVVEYWNSQFRFADERLVVGATSGVIEHQGRPFTHGFEIHLERATLVYEFAVIGDQPRTLMPMTILDSKGKVVQPKLGDGDPMRAFEAEIKHVVQAVRTGKPSPILSGELARDAIILCQKQTKSVESGRPVRV